MKTSTTFKSITLVALLGAALAAPVLAQGGPGTGGTGGTGRMGAGCANVAATQNTGPGNCVGNGAAMGGGRGMGAGMGMGQGGGRAMMAKQNSTRGWALMTPEERTAFQTKMRAVKTYDECVSLQTEHRGAMEVRAKDQGVTLMNPRGNACDNLKARGLIM